MSELVTELHIIGEGSNIFDTDMGYIIPLYQRAYAWDEDQLMQLIEDVKYLDKDANYYIGSLIVSKQSEKYEVIDGQQRLTSLYILLKCLKLDVKDTLTFACREKSNYTLKNIEALIDENVSNLDMERIEASIQRGVKILSQEINKSDFDKESFKEKLKKVIVYRIEVPEHTDLNRYFEIMNTRGEQLEQHDILKAELMSYLNDDAEKNAFAKIWDACSDMTGYVQMHFVSKNNTIRKAIFGGDWDGMPPEDLSKYKEVMKENANDVSGHCIKDIIKKDFKVEDDEGYVDDDIRVRFESIIEFPYFLLHTLKVFIAINGIEHANADSKLIDELLDDKKLIGTFKKVIDHVALENDKEADRKEELSDDEKANRKREFSRSFIIYLLRTRYLFDKYIVKREYANDSTDGEWSLKSLCVSGQKSKKKPYYKNSKFTKSGGHTSTNDRITKKNIMIQSALRVSYTSPKVMHWITKLLIWLSEDNCKHINSDYITRFNEKAEKIAADAVKENFFDECKEGKYAMGVNTPHIVFNYLDYLLWKRDPENEKRYSDFKFEFRNSVEHWYPQHPSEAADLWEDVDQFGNLCIIQRNVNSRFSNLLPPDKKTIFQDTISKGSIKLRMMSELTYDKDSWKKDKCDEHEKEMLRLLKDACGIKQE